MESNTMEGTILQLFITQADQNKTRKSVSSLQVDALGAHADKFYAKDPQRSLLITSVQSYEIAKQQGIDLDYGALGENILIDINPYHLHAGEQITIGNTLLEITQHCTLCKGLSTLDAKLPKLLKNDRGIFAKVIKGDLITRKDTIHIPLKNNNV